jgi:hypothetical protein
LIVLLFLPGVPSSMSGSFTKAGTQNEARSRLCKILLKNPQQKLPFFIGNRYNKSGKRSSRFLPIHKNLCLQ